MKPISGITLLPTHHAMEKQNKNTKTPAVVEQNHTNRMPTMDEIKTTK